MAGPPRVSVFGKLGVNEEGDGVSRGYWKGSNCKKGGLMGWWKGEWM